MREPQNPKVIRINKKVKMNSAIIIFLIILVYVLASLIKSFFRDPVTTYKVSASNINNDIVVTGIAIRQEQEVKSSKSGYIIYYVKDGEKTGKNSSVCSIDETGNIITTIKKSGDTETGNRLFNKDDYNEIRNNIETFKSSYSDEHFSNIYNFRSEIESKVMSLSSQVMMDTVNNSGANITTSLENIVSPDSGVVSYYIDGFESKTVDKITKDDFNQKNYKKTSLKSGDILDSGSTVFKIVSNENWDIVAPITKDQIKLLEKSESENVLFTINNSPNEIGAPYKIIKNGDDNFIDIQLSKYMIDYVSDRYLNIEIILNRYSGLKVPNTSVVKKETYMIPKSIITYDENSASYKTSVDRTDDEGKHTTTKINMVVYKSDDNNIYVDKASFHDTDVVLGTDGSKTNVTSLERSNLSGVYLANEGIADFTEVEVVKSEDEFSIVTNNESLKEFDNIVLNSSEVRENQTLY